MTFSFNFNAVLFTALANYLCTSITAMSLHFFVGFCRDTMALQLERAGRLQKRKIKDLLVMILLLGGLTRHSSVSI